MEKKKLTKELIKLFYPPYMRRPCPGTRCQARVSYFYFYLYLFFILFFMFIINLVIHILLNIELEIYHVAADYKIYSNFINGSVQHIQTLHCLQKQR